MSVASNATIAAASTMIAAGGVAATEDSASRIHPRPVATTHGFGLSGPRPFRGTPESVHAACTGPHCLASGEAYRPSLPFSFQPGCVTTRRSHVIEPQIKQHADQFPYAATTILIRKARLARSSWRNELCGPSTLASDHYPSFITTSSEGEGLCVRTS